MILAGEMLKRSSFSSSVENMRTTAFQMGHSSRGSAVAAPPMCHRAPLPPGTARTTACQGSARDLVDLDGIGEALDGDGTERLDGDEASTRASVAGVRRMLPGLASCSMRAARWVV
jgi:hypothetical protein